MKLIYQFLYGLVFFIFYILLTSYLDFNYLTYIIPLPKDYCFYHTNPAPIWVKWFYLDNSGHIEPLMNKFHIILLIIISISLSYLTVKKLN